MVLWSDVVPFTQRLPQNIHSDALTEIDTESRHALRGRLNDVQLDNLVNEKKKKKRSPTANAYSISPFDF